MKKRLFKLIALFSALAILVCTCGCSLTEYSVEELRALYPKAVENSLKEDLFFWKETTNMGDENTFRKCNVYAEIDKRKYEPLREENGDYSNMDVDIQETKNSKTVLSIQCGDAPSATKGNESKDYLFQTSFEADGKTLISKTKTPMSSKAYVSSEVFQNTYSLNVMLKELKELTVDDMDFDFDKASMTHKGNVVKVEFRVKDSYLERYKAAYGEDSIFAGSIRVALEFAYERVASILVYANEKLDSRFSMDTERYKLEIVYFGPIVSMPKYDEVANGKSVWEEV